MRSKKETAMKNTEIEHKFLVRTDAFKAQAKETHRIQQGYLCRDAERTVRVRICDEHAYLTIKSSVGHAGLSRFEWEREIAVSDAQEMLAFCLPGLISKTRYIIPIEGSERKWEVDVFHDRKEGLVMAEIELSAEDEAFARPEWLGEEVTGKPEYYNANM